MKPITNQDELLSFLVAHSCKHEVRDLLPVAEKLGASVLTMHMPDGPFTRVYTVIDYQGDTLYCLNDRGVRDALAHIVHYNTLNWTVAHGRNC